MHRQILQPASLLHLCPSGTHHIHITKYDRDRTAPSIVSGHSRFITCISPGLVRSPQPQPHSTPYVGSLSFNYRTIISLSPKPWPSSEPTPGKPEPGTLRRWLRKRKMRRGQIYRGGGAHHGGGGGDSPPSPTQPNQPPPFCFSNHPPTTPPGPATFLTSPIQP